MTYYFTTLAVGEPYFTNSLNFYKIMSDRTEHALFNITTTQNDIDQFTQHHGVTLTDYLQNHPKIQVTTLEMFNTAFKTPLECNIQDYFTFNVNLKCMALKACTKSKNSFDYIVYTDSDWNIYDGFDEQKILKAFEWMDRDEVDFAFERPAKIGPNKRNIENCFFPEKVKVYNVLDHDLWDDADVVNEQILMFKNNWKFRLFVMKWEQFLWYSIANSIKNYAEGFEIGVSALEAQMKTEYNVILKLMNECFYFYDRNGKQHIRF